MRDEAARYGSMTGPEDLDGQEEEPREDLADAEVSRRALGPAGGGGATHNVRRVEAVEGLHSQCQF